MASTYSPKLDALSPEESTVEHPAFRDIFNEYGPYVWRALRHLGVRERDVEDVAQEVFVVVHRRLPTFEGRSALRTWIYGICVRTASDHRRRAHVRREHPTEELPEQYVEPTQQEEIGRAQARRMLAQILDTLDDDKRTVFVLYEVEGLSMKEIVQIVDCPLQTAYSRLHAARRQVANAVKRLRRESGA